MDKEILLTQFGRNLRAERTRLGYSREEFAEIVDIHDSYIGKLERGKQNISLIKILKLAQALNISVNDLLKFEEQ